MAVGKAAACTKTSNSKLHSGLLNPYVQLSLSLSLSLSLQIPSILSEELQYNLFMSPGSGGAGLKDALGLPHHSNDARVLTELRKQKSAYKPFD